MDNIFAWTAPSFPYPPYVSLNRVPGHSELYDLTVRAESPDGNKSATVRISLTEIKELNQKLTTHLNSLLEVPK